MRLSGFGRSRFFNAPLVQAGSVETARAALAHARREGRRVVVRGAGYAYGDAAVHDDAVVLDLSGMKRVVSFDAAAGRIVAEAGLSISKLISETIGAGWYPPVVPGTSRPTLGGCAAANVHGKNHLRAGTFGEHLDWIELLDANGEVRRITQDDADFAAVVGGMGLFGPIVRLSLRLARVHSGKLEVVAHAARDLDGVFSIFEANPAAHHIVAWIDATPGRGFGRGIVHLGRELGPDEDDSPEESLLPSAQKIPRYRVGAFLRLVLSARGRAMPVVNALKFFLDERRTGRPYRPTFAEFHFLLDRIPAWNRAYPHGFIQYQPFVPRLRAREVFVQILEGLARAGRSPTLAVLKRHRADPFLLSPSLDGYSLALDLPIASGGLAAWADLLAPYDWIVAASGGRFYLAKDATLRPAPFHRSLGEDLAAFRAAKSRLDPDSVFASALAERVGLVEASAGGHSSIRRGRHEGFVSQ